MRNWQVEARDWIARTHAAMPGATVDELRKALRREASAFHMGTSWGKKVWSQRTREYLAKMAGSGTYRRDGKEQVWPEHIHFPFRDQP